MFSQNIHSSYSPDRFAACRNVIKTPIATSGLSFPQWENQFRDQNLSQAVRLNPLQGLACERGNNGPTRDEQFFQAIVEQRPVFELPTPISMESDAVPAVFSSQLAGSCGLDIGYDEIWVNNDHVIRCSDS